MRRICAANDRSREDVKPRSPPTPLRAFASSCDQLPECATFARHERRPRLALAFAPTAHPRSNRRSSLGHQSLYRRLIVKYLWGGSVAEQDWLA